MNNVDYIYWYLLLYWVIRRFWTCCCVL